MLRLVFDRIKGVKVSGKLGQVINPTVNPAGCIYAGYLSIVSVNRQLRNVRKDLESLLTP